MATPLSIEHLDRVVSTQDEARARYRDGPLLVTASNQDAGRGRGGNRWQDADRAAAGSLATEPGWPVGALPRIALVAGLAVTDVLPPSVGLEWPNDIVVDAKKVGGILSESFDGLVVVGFGLNIYWAAPPEGIGAMHRTDPGEDHGRRIMRRWAEALLERLEPGPDDWGRDEYAQHCRTLDRAVTWEPAGAGRAVGVAEDGGLIVTTDEGEDVLHAGAVSHVRGA